MCGIIGYTGNKNALPILIDGLEKLEYRGYDSAGVAVVSGGKIRFKKRKGRIDVLKDSVRSDDLKGTCGIGHTRWATHGEPSDQNSHPHLSLDQRIALVHNGIIENYAKLKEQLKRLGHRFLSDTDTEVLVHLISHHYSGDMIAAVNQALLEAEGSYAICVLDQNSPDRIICAKKDSPLIIGEGNGEMFIASDIPALLPYTRKVYFLEDGETAIVEKSGAQIFDRYGKRIFRKAYTVDWDISAAEKAGYPHFMLKEIHEGAQALKRTIFPRLKSGRIVFPDLDIKELLSSAQKIFIIACGTAYHAGLTAKYTWEREFKIPIEVDLASEFRYRDPHLSKNTLVILLSQSGETADTLASLRHAKTAGAKTLAITNVVGSSLARLADNVIFTLAGPEISVAASKSYLTQVICLALMLISSSFTGQKLTDAVNFLTALPDLAESVIKEQDQIKKLAHLYHSKKDIYFIGRGIDHAIALEGALKLKELSYIHADAYAAGELKHGPIALIEDSSLVIALATYPQLFDKIAGNIMETRTRGAKTWIITTKSGYKRFADMSDHITVIEDAPNWAIPILAVIPMQYFAYYACIERGFDVDKPRNLAKSVTVE